MTEAEKLKKLKDAHDDKDKIEDLLKDYKPIPANIIVAKIYSNPDYHAVIAVSRVKHKLPVGDTPFGDLPFIQRRKILFMLKDALERYILTMPLQK